jgi:hypothetical protein
MVDLLRDIPVSDRCGSSPPIAGASATQDYGSYSNGRANAWPPQDHRQNASDRHLIMIT